MSLADFQDAFARALFEPDAPVDPALAALAAQPGFAIHRNTVIKGCVDALQANFPAVARLTGERWFRAAAAEYVVAQPPREATLLTHGSTFPDFLAAFPPAASLPYLAGVARLDRAWTEAHVAADAPTLGAGALLGREPGELARERLVPHPATRWAWFDDVPAYSIWRANRAGDAVEEDLAWCGEGALLTRPYDAVVFGRIGVGACRLLDACAHGRTIGEALDDALDAEPRIDLARTLVHLLDAGAFTSRAASQHLPGESR